MSIFLIHAEKKVSLRTEPWITHLLRKCIWSLVIGLFCTVKLFQISVLGRQIYLFLFFIYIYTHMHMSKWGLAHFHSLFYWMLYTASQHFSDLALHNTNINHILGNRDTKFCARYRFPFPVDTKPEVCIVF